MWLLLTLLVGDADDGAEVDRRKQFSRCNGRWEWVLWTLRRCLRSLLHSYNGYTSFVVTYRAPGADSPPERVVPGNQGPVRTRRAVAMGLYLWQDGSPHWKITNSIRWASSLLVRR